MIAIREQLILCFRGQGDWMRDKGWLNGGTKGDWMGGLRVYWMGRQRVGKGEDKGWVNGRTQ